jgi:hypothetical protein
VRWASSPFPLQPRQPCSAAVPKVTWEPTREEVIYGTATLPLRCFACAGGCLVGGRLIRTGRPRGRGRSLPGFPPTCLSADSRQVYYLHVLCCYRTPRRVGMVRREIVTMSAMVFELGYPLQKKTGSSSLTPRTTKKNHDAPVVRTDKQIRLHYVKNQYINGIATPCHAVI